MEKERANSRADLLLSRIVTDRIRKNLQLLEKGHPEGVNISKTLEFASFISPTAHNNAKLIAEKYQPGVSE